MTKGRLEAFSDGVIAILITIMVLELKAPHGGELSDLRPLLPELLSYVLSFTYIGIYWNNHHHLLHGAQQINGGIMWANLHLLFWLSLVTFSTGWMGEHPTTVPTMVYGVILLCSAISYYVLQTLIIRAQGRDSTLARALGRDLKGKLSPVLYLLAIGGALIHVYIAFALYTVVALMWLVPDRRLEHHGASPVVPPEVDSHARRV
jgi:uncharacterized membrane protein